MMTQATQATTLYRYRAEQILTLSDAISACKSSLEGAIAILYSPQDCTLARLSPDNTLRNAVNHEVNFTSVFEARIFNEDCELRWLNRSDGFGDAALIVDDSAKESLKLTSKELVEKERVKCEVLKQQYLLWGEKAKTPNNEGWQRLAEARIGKLDIPLADSFKQEQRVYLQTLEYLAVADGYGNVAVIEERPMKLEVKS